MPRDENGFLKADALRNGLKDQYAIEKDGVWHTVEIIWDRYFYKGYAVRYSQHSDGERLRQEVTTTRYNDDLRAAQRQFTKIVRRLGGHV